MLQSEEVKMPNEEPSWEPMEQPPDSILRISMEYHLSTAAKTSSGTIGIDYQERFVLDRKEGKLELVKIIGSGSKITHTFFLPYAICNLLDELEPEQWRQPLPDAPDDLMEFSDSPQDSPGFYRMTITFQRHPVQEYSGYFDHYGLPGCWKELIWNVLDLIDFYGDIQIISPYLIQKTRRRKSDLILCSVEFEEGGKPYCYLTDDDQLKPGDRVIVPAGRNQVETAVTVTKIEYAQPEQAPFPLEKIKKVRRKIEIKATEEEQNE